MNRYIKPLGLGIVVALACSAAVVARAQTSNWNVGNGNWSVPGNWSPSGVPGAGDTVNIVNSDGVSRTITYDFIHIGPALTLGALTLDLTNYTGANTATLSMSTNSLAVGGNEIVGNSGSGTLSQSGGANLFNSTTGDLFLGNNVGSVGTYNLSGTGALSVNLYELVGYFGTGTITQTGGTNTIIAGNGGALYIGNWGSSTGTYNLSGTGSLSVGGNEYVGNLGTGTFTQSGGSNIVALGLYVGFSSGSTGTYNLNSGTLSTGSLFSVGESGTGVFNQTGGSNTISSNSPLFIGDQVGSSGTYNLSGGALSTSTTNEIVGGNGAGTLNQTGGTNTIYVSAQNLSFELILGNIAGSTGTYELSGNGSLVVNGIEVVGNSGAGSIIQSGGSNTIFDPTGGKFSLRIGVSSGSNGTYTLSGGSLTTVGNEDVGASGTGTFNETGGINSITGFGALNVGISSGSSGSYSISGGTINVGQGGVMIGNVLGGVGVFSITGNGILSTPNINVFNGPGDAFNLSGGTVNTTALDFNGNPALFNWTSGTLNINSNVTWDSLASSTTTSAAFGTALTLGTGQTLMVTGNEGLGGTGPFSLTLHGGSTHYVTGSLTLNPTGTITQNAGSTLYAATFTQAGGTVNGTLQNQGSFIYQSGQFNGRLLNQGALTLGPNFTAGNGVENDTNMALSAGQTLTVNGAGLDNVGTFVLSGGVISGSGPALNDIGGTMQARGTINPEFTNNGQFSVTGALNFANATAASNNGVFEGSGTVAGSFVNTASGTVNVAAGNVLAFSSDWSNSGLVTLQGAGAVLNGVTITNSGTIQGAGTIGASVINSAGVIWAVGGELDLAGAGNTNPTGGQIQIDPGAKLRYLQGLATNDGFISLTGGTFDNNNQLLSNAVTGIINGYGTLRSGGLISTGALNVGGGDLNVLGNFTNNGTVSIQSGRTAYFYGNVNGAGSYTGSGTAYYLAGFSPGNSPASVSFGGNVTLASSATLDIELGGTTSGTQYDQVHVTSQLTLGGALDVTLINGFKPDLSEKFDILDWGTKSGTFSALQLPALGGTLGWNVSNLYSTGVLSVIDLNRLPGDLNHDGLITAADFTLLELALTNKLAYELQTGVSDADLAILGDADESGAVDNGDMQALLYEIIHGTSFVAGSAPPLSVPEPASISLLLMGAIAGLVIPRTFRRGVRQRRFGAG